MMTNQKRFVVRKAPKTTFALAKMLGSTGPVYHVIDTERPGRGWVMETQSRASALKEAKERNAEVDKGDQ
jgi:hypothetical protein